MNELPPPSFKEATRVFARIGVLSFGGPAGQIALMHKLLVDERRWISEERFLHALSYCMLLPGPEAQQLATYIGWLMYGVRGGLIAGLLFILPGLAVIVCLSAAYALLKDASLFATLFFGVKAGMLAIVLQALTRLARRALKTRFHLALSAMTFLLVFAFKAPFPIVVIAAALAGAAPVLYSRHASGAPSYRLRLSWPKFRAHLDRLHLPPLVKTVLLWIAVWQAPLLIIDQIDARTDIIAEVLSGEANVFGAIFAFFSRMALVGFGGAYAVLAYVAQTAVDHYAWLRPGEMLDGLALAEATPGPLVLVLSFVGFMAGFRNPLSFPPLAAGALGALLAAWATFAPSFLFIFAGAPYVERLRSNRTLSAALAGITAAVVGVMANLALWFGLHVLFSSIDQLVLWTRRVSAPGSDVAHVPILTLPWPVWTTLDLSAVLVFLLACVLVYRRGAGVGLVIAVSAATGGLLRLAG
ncbi:chromate efflux transporter [Rhizobium sp. RAF56]|uniref:chromate efflux transporter n=1 Tax=Rhizobium sp. RAF56 TaxID=3233062 RepID=UPI003F9AC037